MLLVVDLDGSLINYFQEITPFTLNFLKEFIKDNYLLINTGRIFKSSFKYVKTIADNFNDHIFLACGNGTEIYQYDKIIDGNYINTKNIYEIIKHKDLGTYLALGRRSSDLEPKLIDDLTKDNSLMLCELSLLTSNKHNFKHEDYHFFYQGLLNEYHWYYIQNDKKDLAVAKVREILNIKKDDVYVFGDEQNDIKTLRSYTNSYLMKNSKLKLKGIKRTLATNESDGIAKTMIDILDKKTTNNKIIK